MTTTKLSDERIDQLLAAKKTGATNRELAMRFGCSAATISDYVTGKRGKSGAPQTPESARDDLADYRAYLARKLAHVPPTGITDPRLCSDELFPFQRDLALWALRRGRAAIFSAMGTGKTRIQGVWAFAVAQYTGLPVIIFAPLAVSHQTIAELAGIGIVASLAKDGGDIVPNQPGIYITNIDRMHKFDATVFGGVVIDESSILKHETSKTLQFMVDAYARTPFRLCCTATPSPNDYAELGTHAEFLGVCTRLEMLAEYFTHDGSSTQDWRLKRHARKAFWQFVATWAALVRSPADLGYDASAYTLPTKRVVDHVIAASEECVQNSGGLFAAPARTLMERRTARKASIEDRVRQCAALANSDIQPWIVWATLNAESEALTKAIDGAVEVTGSMSSEEKEAALNAFSRGEARVLVSKSSICGFGMNWQHCARMAYVGVDDSYEREFQATGRIYRFGQKREVEIHRFFSELEGEVVKNLERKASDAEAMADELSRETAALVRAEVMGGARKVNEYEPRNVGSAPAWLQQENG